MAKEILHLNSDQRITSLFVDSKSNSLFLGLSDGRIIKACRSVINAYATGKRVISAKAIDSYGYLSEETMMGVLYSLSNVIAKISGNTSSIWKTNYPYSAIKTNEVQGVFTSQPLWAGEDFVIWKEILWDAVNPDGTETILQVRSASEKEQLEFNEWKTFNAISGQHFENLDLLGIKNPWIQLRCILKTSTKDLSPTINNISIVYRTKSSVFFYTTKIVMERGSNLESGLLIANMDTPRNTEIKIGISDINSNEWNDYQIINPEKSFLINKKGTERIKIGFKLISSSPDVYAGIDEFALMIGGEKMEILKET